MCRKRREDAEEKKTKGGMGEDRRRVSGDWEKEDEEK